MVAHPTHAAHPDDPAQPAAPAHPHRQALDDLVTMGTSLARLLHAQAVRQAEAVQAAVPPHPIPHASYEPPATTLVTLATAFDRIARAVRRCIALARRLDEPVRATPNPAQHRTAARKQVIRAVEDTIHRTAPDDAVSGGDRAESLNAELRDRLDDPDLDWDLTHRPIPDIIAEIRRDLGLAAPPGDNPWRRRTLADIQDLQARAAAPSNPNQPGPAQHPNQGPSTPPLALASAKPVPAKPAAPPRAWPAHADNGTLPDDPAEAVALIFRHPGQWRPPLPDSEPA